MHIELHPNQRLIQKTIFQLTPKVNLFSTISPFTFTFKIATDQIKRQRRKEIMTIWYVVTNLPHPRFTTNSIARKVQRMHTSQQQQQKLSWASSCGSSSAPGAVLWKSKASSPWAAQQPGSPPVTEEGETAPSSLASQPGERKLATALTPFWRITDFPKTRGKMGPTVLFNSTKGAGFLHPSPKFRFLTFSSWTELTNQVWMKSFHRA